MAEDKPDECLAFPRANGTWGNGTLNMIGQCAARGIKVTQMRPEDLTNAAAPAAHAQVVERASSREENPIDSAPSQKEGS